MSQSALAGGAPGRACGLGALSVVGYLAGQALIGGSCGRPGVVGLFAERSGAWRLVGPVLPRALGQGRAEVLSLGRTKVGTSAILEISNGTANSLVVAWAARSGRWGESPVLRLGAGENVASAGPSAGTGVFVLLRSPSGQERLMASEIRPVGTSCHHLLQGRPRSPLAARIPMPWSLVARCSPCGPWAWAPMPGPRAKSSVSRSSSAPRRELRSLARKTCGHPVRGRAGGYLGSPGRRAAPRSRRCPRDAPWQLSGMPGFRS